MPESYLLKIRKIKFSRKHAFIPSLFYSLRKKYIVQYMIVHLKKKYKEEEVCFKKKCKD
jgi:hypothetical protein